MAGVVPKRATSGRKQWTLHDGPTSSLKQLRHQLASDGCPESQVVLAKKLLDEQCVLEEEQQENAQLGVYWLLQASQQGNTEATDLLKTCLQTGKGITELNYLDVKKCISMPQDEKLARRAAKEMFASLSNGGDYITSDQLQRKILSIDKEKETGSSSREAQEKGQLLYEELDSDEDTDWSQKSDSSNEKITEDCVISAAVDFSHGHLPIVTRALCLVEPDLKALDHVPLIQKSILHPILALRIIYYKIVELLGKCHIIFPLVRTEIQLLCLTLVYVLVNVDNFSNVLPTILYVASFAIMCVTTFKMVQTDREFHAFRLWSGLFICYSGGELNPSEAEFLYLRNNLRPYAVFFLALLVNLFVYPLISDNWIPQSELMITSFCITFITLVSFMPKRRSKTIYDPLVLLSFGVNVLAKYPYETDVVVAQGWRYLDLKVPNFASYVIGNGVDFCINFRLVLYLFVPLMFVRIASRDNWRGSYKTLLPHCVTLSWLQICILSSQGATTFGLLRGSLALAGLVLFLPLVGLTSVMLPAAALTKWILTSNFIYNACIFVVLAGMILGLWWLFLRSRLRKITAFLQVVSTFCAVFLLLRSIDFGEIFKYQGYDDDKLPQILTWDVYQRFCHQPIWQEDNLALSQIKCAELDGSLVHWDAYVTDIKVKSVGNRWRDFFDKFPNLIRHYLYCFYGDPVSTAECNRFPDLVREDCFAFFNAIKSVNSCSLEKFNVYTFEISARLHAGIWGKSPEVRIRASTEFKNFTLGLKPNDHVWFKGRLFNNEEIGSDGVLGGLRSHVRLDQIGCHACSNQKLTVGVKKLGHEGADFFSSSDCVVVLKSGLKFVLNVLLNPLFFK